MIERVTLQGIDHARKQKMKVLRNNVVLATVGASFTAIGAVDSIVDPTATGFAVLGTGIVSAAVGGAGVVRGCGMPNQNPEYETEEQINHAVPRSHQRSGIYESNRSVANQIADRSNHEERRSDTDRSIDTNTRESARTNEQGQKRDKKVNMSPKPRPRSIERTMNPY